MAQDRSPKRRQAEKLKRSQGKRKLYDRVLIVCEGSKTEPNYFNEIRRELRLPTTRVLAIPSEAGSEPMRVVSYAEDLFRNGDRHHRIDKKAFDRIFVVFDRDEHKNYHAALDRADSLDGTMRNEEKTPVSFEAIVSVPCFELWLLLHYQDVHAPITRFKALEELQRHFPAYAKNARNVYADLKAYLANADRRARELSQKNSPRNGEEPYTTVYKLVDALMRLSGK
jgi:hypothetical protein